MRNPSACRPVFKPSRVLAVLAVGIAIAGCARGSAGPEARLGRTGGQANAWDKSGSSGVGRGPLNDTAGGLGAPGSAAEFKNGAGDVVYFSSDSTDLTPEARKTLDLQARWLTHYPNQALTIEGHADERGTREYNIGLGAKRAASVRAFLVEHGVAAARIRTVSFGKERPIATCDDISCWSQNRRAQTILQNPALSRN
jgi:peptidoglycan-associated lipoprotein